MNQASLTEESGPDTHMNEVNAPAYIELTTDHGDHQWPELDQRSAERKQPSRKPARVTCCAYDLADRLPGADGCEKRWTAAATNKKFKLLAAQPRS